MDPVFVSDVIENFVPSAEALINRSDLVDKLSGRVGGDRFIVQKAHIFAKYPSSTSCEGGGCGFDDPRQGTEQYDQQGMTPVNVEKLEEALYWQRPHEAAPDGQDDLNRKWADYRHLEELVEMVSPGKHLQRESSNLVNTTVATSVSLPTFSTRMRGRSTSSFRSYSLRWILSPTGVFKFISPVFLRIIPDTSPSLSETFLTLDVLKHPRFDTTYCIQVDVLDFLTRHPTSTLGKRLRRAVDSFGQLSPRCAGDTSGGNELLHVKKVTGVRLRANKYVAEVKPPGRNGKKVHLGRFDSQPEAARARDVGTYLYHRDKERLHYEDTPQIISTLLTSAGHDADDELLKFAGLDDKEKEKIVKELAKKTAQEQAEKLPSTHPRCPKTMRTSMRTEIFEDRVQIVEQTVDLESSGFKPRSCASDQSEIEETTCESSDSWINEDGGILTTETEQSRLSEIEEWLGSVILEGTSVASTVHHRSPHELEIDMMDQRPEVPTETSEFVAPDWVGAMILELSEGQDMCQRSVELAAGHSSTNLETFGSMEFAMSVTYQTMNLAASTSLIGTSGDGYSSWGSEAQAMAMGKPGLFS